ncbi:MAG: sulfur carrier protein ThiS [Betaproteobacteria bacterium]|nr:sulfur carrier protein ThiS [Betaproteobacteria bacterium]
MAAIKVSLNGEPTDADDARPLAEQLGNWGYPAKQPLAVAVDGRLVPSADRDRLQLAAGSQIEVFSVRQGG